MGSILKDWKSTGLGSLHKEVKKTINTTDRQLKARRRKVEAWENKQKTRKKNLKVKSERSIAKHPYVQKPVKRQIDKKALHKRFKLMNIQKAQAKKPRYDKWGDRMS